jgi:hypothetical protein
MQRTRQETALREVQGKLRVPRFEVVGPELRHHGEVGILTYRLPNS